jgi:hypothetical protein
MTCVHQQGEAIRARIRPRLGSYLTLLLIVAAFPLLCKAQVPSPREAILGRYLTSAVHEEFEFIATTARVLDVRVVVPGDSTPKPRPYWTVFRIEIIEPIGQTAPNSITAGVELEIVSLYAPRVVGGDVQYIEGQPGLTRSSARWSEHLLGEGDIGVLLLGRGKTGSEGNTPWWNAKADGSLFSLWSSRLVMSALPEGKIGLRSFSSFELHAKAQRDGALNPSRFAIPINESSYSLDAWTALLATFTRKRASND